MVVNRRIEFVRTGWGTRVLAVVGMALGLGLAAALILLSVSIAIVLLPLVLIGLLVARWRWRKLMADSEGKTGRGDGGPPIIELDYEVVDKPSDSGREGHSR
jgi:hypothetical protein